MHDIPRMYDLDLPATLTCRHGELNIDFDSDAISPRLYRENYAHLWTWERGWYSPDRPEFSGPQEFLSYALERLYPDSPQDNALQQILSMPDSPWHIQGDDLMREDESVIYDYDDRFYGTICDALAQYPEAAELLNRRMPIQPIYSDEPNGNHQYSVIPSAAAWDGDIYYEPLASGMVGFGFMWPEEAEEHYGTGDGALRAAHECIAAELDTYNQWANGYTYCFEYVGDDGTEETVGGFIGDDALEDMLAFLSEDLAEDRSLDVEERQR